MKQTIKCKSCGAEIEVSEALTHQLQEQIEASLKISHQKELAEVSEKARSEAIESVSSELQEKIENVSKEKDREAERNEKLSKQIGELLDKISSLEDKDRDRENETKKLILEEKRKAQDDAAKKAQEEARFEVLELKKQLEDSKKSLDDANRKLSQKSQQLQGEIFELDLEKDIKENFPHDEVLSVAKGVSGADIKQLVKSNKGFMCGTILWEIKRTKSWDVKWTTKLKSDLRAEKANIPIIITAVLPIEAEKGLGLVNGVWVADAAHAILLARLLRDKLIGVAYQKFISDQKVGKADDLYDYATGHEFVQQLDAQVEVFNAMRLQIAKEKRALEALWKVREAQVNTLERTLTSIYGGVKAAVGSSMPQVKGLELPELPDGELE